jgi:hypothetical protein
MENNTPPPLFRYSAQSQFDIVRWAWNTKGSVKLARDTVRK